MGFVFGGHQSFHIREGWLRKGILGIEDNPHLFADPYAGDVLGVGHNMVAAIRYWLQATGLVEAYAEAKDGTKTTRFMLTALAETIRRYDPYFEEDGTLWVIHHHLASNKRWAPTWFWIFNVFGIRDFTQDLALAHLERYVEADLKRKVSSTTLEREFRCFVRTYTGSDVRGWREGAQLGLFVGKRAGADENYDCPLANLNLLHPLPRTKSFRLMPPSGATLDSLLVAYALAGMQPQLPLAPTSISLRDAVYEPGSPGRIFLLDAEALYEHLSHLEAEEGGMVSFARTAGLNVITLKCTEPLAILARYYERVRAMESEHDQIAAH